MFLPTVGKRGAAIIEACGLSSANAAIEHMRDWAFGTNGEYKIVQGLEIDEFSQERINITLKELTNKRDAIAHLL